MMLGGADSGRSSCAGNRSNVTTTGVAAYRAATERTSFSSRWCPRWTPSKHPRVTTVGPNCLERLLSRSSVSSGCRCHSPLQTVVSTQPEGRAPSLMPVDEDGMRTLYSRHPDRRDGNRPPPQTSRGFLGPESARLSTLMSADRPHR